MIEFVDECRRVWRQLGVPDPVANEMAADLTADLLEAEAEGGSAEDVLGNSAFDAAGFAASWAAARGVTTTVPATSWPPPAPGRRPPIAAVLTGLVSLLAIGAGLVVLGTGRATGLAVAAQRAITVRGPLGFAVGPGPAQSAVGPAGQSVVGPPGALFMHPMRIGLGPNLLPLALVLLVLGVVGLGLTLWYWSPWSVGRLRPLRVRDRA